jgi:actin beta/gamma 1
MTPTVVLDLGSGSIKAGIVNRDEKNDGHDGDYFQASRPGSSRSLRAAAGPGRSSLRGGMDESDVAPTGPSYDIPAVIGTPMRRRGDSFLHAIGEHVDRHIGADALDRASLLRLEYPMEYGLVTNWDSMEILFKHTFDDVLEVKSGDQPLLLADAPLTPRRMKEKMAELLFESFQVPSMSIIAQAMLVMYGYGRLDGVLVDSGHAMSHIMPMHQGFVVPHAVTRLGVSGRDVTHVMTKALVGRGFGLTFADTEVVRKCKERFAFVALDYELAMQKAVSTEHLTKSYELPDGTKMELGVELFHSPEIMFQPDITSDFEDEMSVQQALYDSVMMCDITTRRAMIEHVYLSGGNTLFKGFAGRLQRELALLNGDKYESTVHRSSEQQFAVWNGAAALAGHSSFQKMLVDKKEYEESGHNALHRIMLYGIK